MSARDDEPPVVMPPVRRDPTLGLRVQENDYYRRVGPNGEITADPEDSYWRGAKMGARFGLLVLLAVALAVAGVVALGFTAHAIWHAIMLGWRLGR